MLNHFTFNGKSTGDFGLLVDGLSTFGTPTKRVETIQIPGRNGLLLLDKGTYTNYDAIYEVSVINNFKANARAIAEWLLSAKGYQRLEDTYYPDQFRLATCISAIDYTVTALAREGTAKIEFSCQPQRFLKSGEEVTTLTSSGTITNPTSFTAKPLIRIYGKGTLRVGSTTVTVNTSTNYVDIDCDRMQCYEGSINRNNNVTVDTFPTLEPGENTITISGSITQVDITPRWWII